MCLSDYADGLQMGHFKSLPPQSKNDFAKPVCTQVEKLVFRGQLFIPEWV